jgi:phosphohistidine phosphatase
MQLFILRHGKAERHATSGRDEDRPLADRGRAQCQYLAGLFTSILPRPALILSSPAVRADATAAIIALALNLKVRHEEALALDTTFKGALSLVEGLLDRPAPALLVGHNPTLSRLIDHLAAGDELRTGELSVLDLTSLADARELTRFRLDD